MGGLRARPGGQGMEKENVVRGYLGGKGEKMRKGLLGAFASKDPAPAPSSQSLLCPPASSHPSLEEKRSQAACPTTTGPARRVSGAGRRDSRKERERVVGCSEGQGSGLVAQASMRWGRDKGEGSSSEGPRPASLKGDAPLTTVISRPT